MVVGVAVAVGRLGHPKAVKMDLSTGTASAATLMALQTMPARSIGATGAAHFTA